MVAEMPDLKIDVVDGPDKVHQFWEWLTSHHESIGADTETTGTDPYVPGFKIRLFQFGDTTSGWAIPYQGWQLLVHGALDWLRDHGVRVVWHNLAFDAKALSVSGYQLDMSLQDDTYIWAGLLGFAEDSRALKTIAAREFGDWTRFGQALLHKSMANAGWGWDTVPLTHKPYVAYGAIDPIITMMYYERLGERGREKFRWHHSLEIAAVELTNRMAQNGLAVDTAYCAHHIEEFGKREQVLLDELRGYGVESPNQNAVVAKVLTDAGVVPDVVKLTSTGQLSVDKEFLSTIDHPVARAVLASRSLHRTKSYLEAMITAAHGVIGTRELIHPEIRAMEARTGRSSISSPALQQLPSVDDSNPDSLIVRGAVRARAADEVLVGADFGQIELRMFASMSRDQALMDVLNGLDEAKRNGDKGADFFVHLGRDLYDDPDFKKSDPRRTPLKSTIYATLFGAGETTIAQTAKVPVATISGILKALASRYVAFQDLGHSWLTNQPNGAAFVTTPTGREFRVHTFSERRKLPNYRIQGHSAEILKMAMVNIAEAGYEENLMLPVHDELIMSVPRSQAKQATTDLVEAMNAVVDAAKYGVAVQASPAEPADDWASLSH